MIARAVVPTLAAAILITAAGTAAAEMTSPLAPLPAFDETPFGPRYVIEDVRVTGNRKTERSLIAGELAALGLAPGRDVDASDRRVETARYRLLSLGYFLDVHLSVARGSRRGAVVLIVDVEERGTLVINEIFAATSPATFFWGGTDLVADELHGPRHQPGRGVRRLDAAAGPRRARRAGAAAARGGPAAGRAERRRAVGHRALQRRQRVLPRVGGGGRQRSRAVRGHPGAPDRRRADGGAAVARQLPCVGLVPARAGLRPAAAAGASRRCPTGEPFRSTS